MFNKIKWISILSISIMTTALLITGLFISLSLTSGVKGSGKEAGKAAKKPAAPKVSSANFNILVLGDSLAKGTGDEKNLGFSGYVAGYLKTKISKPVIVSNLAVNGDVSSGLLKIVQSPDTSPFIASSSLIMISIGGNEITRFRNLDLSLAEARVKSTEDDYIINLKRIISIIRSRNRLCPIAFIGLYNPFGKDVTMDKINLLNNWNYNTEQLLSSDSNSLFIPTYDLFKNNLDKYLTIDKFHPNNAGYRAIGNRLIESLGSLR